MIRNRILERRVPPKNPLFAGLNPALINKSGKSKPTGDAERQSIVLSTLLPAHGSQQLDSRFNALGNFSARTRPTLIGCGARYGLPRKSTSASPPAATPRKHLHGWFRSPPAIAEPSRRCRRVVPNFLLIVANRPPLANLAGLGVGAPGQTDNRRWAGATHSEAGYTQRSGK
jgi:hypothetical protein